LSGRAILPASAGRLWSCRRPTTLDEARCWPRTAAQRPGPGQRNGESLRRTASIGVATGTPVRHGAADLMRHGRPGTAGAKSAAATASRCFQPGLALKTTYATTSNCHLRRRHEANHWCCTTSPSRLRTGKVRAIEALCRWQHPTGQLVPEHLRPGPNPAICREWGRIVLRTACGQLHDWHRGASPTGWCCG
jgi:predicted signal transduction protein with EAL and GGDEF domain